LRDNQAQQVWQEQSRADRLRLCERISAFMVELISARAAGLGPSATDITSTIFSFTSATLYYAFDVLWSDGLDLRFSSIWRLLRAVFRHEPTIGVM
jgi:hypothetical protein